MKKNLTILILFVSLLIASDTSKTIKTYKNGNISSISYHTDTEDGQKIIRQETFHFTGSKAMEGNIQDDYKVGIWTYYFQNGEKRLEGEYILGQKDGLWTYWYDNGIIASKYFYQSKTIDGERMEWHIDKECWTRSAIPCECGSNWWSECENR
ncbi:hypothetical protein N8331_00170 [bacterium]|nr:hypothetical protein [bacterium]